MPPVRPACPAKEPVTLSADPATAVLRPSAECAETTMASSVTPADLASGDPHHGWMPPAFAGAHAAVRSPTAEDAQCTAKAGCSERVVGGGEVAAELEADRTPRR